MRSRTEYSDYIESALRGLSYPEKPSGLYEPVIYTLQRGGKRIRPMLLLATADAFGADFRCAVNQALGIEMFHNFTLLHDDVMDNADLRRGCPTVHKKWNESTAILSGDAMLTMATMLMSRCNESVLPQVLNHFNKTAMEIYEGQQYDMDFENRLDVSIDEYLMMIRLKTSVLLGAACYLGAIVALDDAGSMDSLGQQRAEAMYEYGIKLGLAFQLRDDYLDTYGDPLTFGKEIGGDIVNNKKSWLLTAALSMDTEEKLANHIIKKTFDGDPHRKIEEFKKIYDELGVQQQCIDQINAFISEAISYLDKAGITPESRQFFTELALSSSTRIN